MPLNCSFPIPTPLKCKFPVCPCAKCRDRREEGSQRSSIEEKDYEAAGGSSDTNRNFMSFLTDTICIIAFFIIATAIFWIAVAHYTFVFGMKIYKSDRNPKIATLILIGLLALSISYSMLRKNGKSTNHKEDAFPAPCCIDRKSSDTINMPAKCKQNLAGKGTSITDSCAKEIFEQSNLFAIPTEMKQPPALLVYLKDVILSSIETFGL